LRKLKARQSDCCWVAEAVGVVPSAPIRTTKTKRSSK